MPSRNGIFWLASYPKSGNTWLRIVIVNLLNPSKGPIDLSQIKTGDMASSRTWINNTLAFVDSGSLTHDEVDQLRPAVYRWQGEHADGVSYHKIHDAYTYLNDKTPLIPVEGCLGALYLIRNPLDLVISFSYHLNCSIDEAIDKMGDKHFAFGQSKYRPYGQLRQHLLSWSEHVQSWTAAKDMNVMVIRYEDMKLKPLETFTQAADFLRLDASEEAIAKALDNARIEKLQEQETQFGFVDRPANVERFFRKGIVGEWRDVLTQAQIKKIVQRHGDVMKAYGYLPKSA